MLFVERTPSALWDVSQLRRRAYAKLWLTKGAQCAQELPGNTVESVSTARGSVLEIGAGSGELLQYYDPSKITNIIGVEPAEDLHARLRIQANENGFADKYTILSCSAEPDSLIPALLKTGLISTENGGELFDTIICVRVLCIVPMVDRTVSFLYRCLKPGGRLIICEHGVSDWYQHGGSIIPRALQAVYMSAGWSFFMGDCHLDRDFRKILNGAAKEGDGWAEVKVETFDAWSVLPYTVGTLMK